MQQIHLRTLGALDLLAADGTRIQSILQQPKRLAVFLYLVLARPYGFQRRDTLLAMFWPEQDQEKARKALNQSVHVLRRSLGKNAVLSNGDEELSVDSSLLVCDAIQFEEAISGGRLPQALEIYHGDLLSGFYISDAPGLERWLDGERLRLRERASIAARTLTKAAQERGDMVAAVTWARRAADIAPEVEEDVRRLMELLEQTGDRVGAVRAYDDYARRLLSEYDLEPGAETRRLVDRIRSDEAAASAKPKTDGQAPRGPAVFGPATDSAGVREGPARDGAYTAGAGAGGAGHAAADSAGGRSATPGKGTSTSTTGTTIKWTVGLVAVILIALIAFPLVRRARDGKPSPTAAAPGPPTSIAVLYFEDNSRDAKLGYLSRVITSALIDELTGVKTLSVVSMNGIMPFRASTVPLDSIARALHVGSMVSGSVESSGGRVRIRVQLIDASNSRALYSDTITRPMGEEFALVDGVVGDVAAFLRVHLGKEIELKKWQSGTQSVDAWNLVKTADDVIQQSIALSRSRNPTGAAAGLQNAEAMLLRAQKLDPAWSEPLLLRSRIAENVAWMGVFARQRAAPADVAFFQRAVAYADTALRLKPNDPAVLEQRGVTHSYIAGFAPAGSDLAASSLRAAERDLNEATNRDAARARAWNVLSLIMLERGDYARSKLDAEQAYRADAYLQDSRSILTRLFASTFELNQDAEAKHWCDETAAKHGGTAAEFCKLQLLGWSTLEKPNPDEAWRILEQAGRSDPPQILTVMRPRLAMMVGAVLARAGLTDSARAVIDRAAHEAAGDPEREYFEAAARAAAGQRELAFQLLEAYVRANPVHRGPIPQRRMFFPLRDLPAFRVFIKKD